MRKVWDERRSDIELNNWLHYGLGKTHLNNALFLAKNYGFFVAHQVACHSNNLSF